MPEGHRSPLIESTRARVLQRVPELHLFGLFRRGLRETGWWRSCRLERPVDQEGSPLPWFSYSAIHFLNTRASTGLRVFEYGAGHSTLWWADRCARVDACEHDPEWFAEVARRVPANASVRLRTAQDSYVRSVDERGPYDVIVIDGEWRTECALVAVDALSAGGVIIWDDSHRSAYGPGMDRLIREGFKQLPFSGFRPISVEVKETTVFYRRDNCLAI